MGPFTFFTNHGNTSCHTLSINCCLHGNWESSTSHPNRKWKHTRPWSTLILHHVTTALQWAKLDFISVPRACTWVKWNITNYSITQFKFKYQGCLRCLNGRCGNSLYLRRHAMLLSFGENRCMTTKWRLGEFSIYKTFTEITVELLMEHDFLVQS